MRRVLITLLFLLPVELEAQQIVGPKGSIHTPSFNFGNTVYVPLSSFAQAYGMVETWDSKTKTASLKSADKKLSFQLGSSHAWVNGKIMQMSAPAKMVNGKLLIPFQFVLALSTPSPPPPAPKGTFTILLDPGHGGNDVGARGKKGLNEKDINLDIAKKVSEKLSSKGIKVLLTRSRDEFITLWRRSYLSRSLKPNLFVSIHTNAARSKDVHGVEIFYFAQANSKQNGPQYKQNQSKSYQFARGVQYHMGKLVKNKSRGVKSAKYYILKNATTPTVLIEVGFITHPWEESNLINSSYRDKIAQAITQSVLDFKAKN